MELLWIGLLMNGAWKYFLFYIKNVLTLLSCRSFKWVLSKNDSKLRPTIYNRTVENSGWFFFSIKSIKSMQLETKNQKAPRKQNLLKQTTHLVDQTDCLVCCDGDHVPRLEEYIVSSELSPCESYRQYFQDRSFQASKLAELANPQFGFMLEYFVDLLWTLLHLTNFIHRNINAKSATGVVFLDIEKAFDAV